MTFALVIGAPSAQAQPQVDSVPDVPIEWEEYLEVGDGIDSDVSSNDPTIPIDPNAAIPDEIPIEIPTIVPLEGTPVTPELGNLTSTTDEIAGIGTSPSEEPAAASLAAASPAAAVGGAVQMGAAVATAAYISDGARWREIAPLMTLFSRLRRERLLDHPAREMIYEEIRSHAGIHYRKLLRTLRVSNGTLSFHLRHLERGGFVRSVRVRGRRHFYVTEGEPGPEAFLVTNSQRLIMTFLRGSPGASQREIARELGMSRSNVSYHVAALRSLGLVKTERVGNLSRCFLSGP